MKLVWLLFSINGRINRATYWMVVGVLFGVMFPLHVSSRKTPDSALPFVYQAFILLSLWPSIAVQAKRWHDIDKSGWWTLINLVPFVGPLFGLIANGLMIGTQGTNRFGDDPSASLETPMLTRCSACFEELDVPLEDEGRRLKCPHCGLLAKVELFSC